VPGQRAHSIPSRPSFADVVWIDLATGKIVAEQQMDGYRTDHMTVSPNGRRLLVSDSTANTVHEYVMGGVGRKRTGTRLRTFESGDTPHESNYTRDGSRVFHASIGRVYTPVDYPEVGPVVVGGVHDAVKANRWLEIVDTRTFAIQRRWDMGKELAEAGYPGLSSAVRPMALTPDEKTAFLQVSFLHGIVEFAFEEADPTGGGDYTSGTQSEPATGVVKRVIPLPISDKAAATAREDYVLDSAHHGIAMNGRGTKLCVAGTMSDYAAVVNARTGRYTILDGKARFLEGRAYSKPYWATTSRSDGNCWVSMSGSDLVTIIDYSSKKVVAEVPVGRHPQRVRDGVVDGRVLRSWANGGASGTADLSSVPVPAGQLAAANAWMAAAIAAITP
jgi:YVTN family beta-propeller protein